MHLLNRENPYLFLEIYAIETGALETCLIPSGGIIVENGGTFKCRFGCPYYGTSLVCPPHAPHPDEFRKIISDYTWALMVRFQTSISVRDETACSLLRITEPDISPELKEETQNFSVALMAGPCTLCNTCSGIRGLCSHPTMRHFPADALGVNVIKTAKLDGMEISFPFQKSPSSLGVLFID